MKVCSKCKEEKELMEFSDNKSECKQCIKERNKKYYKENREKIIKQNKEYIDNNKVSVINRRKKHYTNNKERVNKINKENYLINKEYRLAKAKDYYQKNKESITENNNKNKIERARKAREYFQTYKGKEVGRLSSAKRRALKKTTDDGSITHQSLDAMLLKQGNKCNECFIDITNREDRHLDHIYPLSKGGKHVISNVQWLCCGCNLIKSNKVYETT